MALQKRGKYRYGDLQLDIRDELLRYSKDGYLAAHFADAICVCDNKTFTLFLDDDEGVAIRICNKCKHEHPIGDSEEFMEEAELSECECPCSAGQFEITVGVALYQKSEDVKWIYIGCRCVKCGLTACYGDWKNEFEGFRELLNRI